MRWCAWCNRSLGESEEGAVVEGRVVHANHEAAYRKQLSDMMARLAGHRLLYLPSLGRDDDELSDCP